jgi:hypothetical protein
MSIQIAGGLKEDGIIVGNAYDKYGSRNPIVKGMMHGFTASLSDFVAQANPATIHEVGCGEGYFAIIIKNTFLYFTISMLLFSSK